MESSRNRLFLVMILLLGLITQQASAQCPRVFDFYGQTPTTPYWYACSGDPYTLNISTPNNWNGFTVNWGDGSPVTSGASWGPTQFQSHLYAAAVDTFNLTITETATGCVVHGVLIMEEAASASIQIPVGGLTQACAPQMMEFINSSTNVSETTVFTWDFGDGSPQEVYNYTNWLQTIQHTYEVGTVTCETEVTLTAENYCNIVQGGSSTATFNPIRIWDLDDPAITPSAMLLCYPDTTVTFTNTTYRNCLFQGNIYQRYEYWNFGDYWGLGHDSIIDWTPWPPTFPHTLSFPGIGSYTVELLDSNYCGVAPASVTIQIVPPPVANITPNQDTVCVGTPIIFYQNATGGANLYKWKFGNSAWIQTGSGNITYTFNQAGTFQVGSMVAIQGATAGCYDTVWVQIVVLPNPSVDVTANQTAGCDSLTVDFNGVTPNAVAWNWNFGSAAPSFAGLNPPLIHFGNPGNYQVTLTATNAFGCSANDQITIRVYANPVANFNVFNLCEGEVAQFTDISTHANNDNIVSWAWNFGDGVTSNQQNPNHGYAGVGVFQVVLNLTTQHCFDSDTMTVEVNNAPVADILETEAEGCAPLDVVFTNNSETASVYEWTTGDGNEFQTTQFAHTYFNNSTQSITYTLVLSAMNEFGCGSTDTAYVTAYPGATAMFQQVNNPSDCGPFTAHFVNQSSNAISYHWDLGDGTTSNQVNPTHTYTNNTGVLQFFDVTLIAYNQNGCNDTITQQLLVFPVADMDFTISGVEGCSPLTVTMPYVTGIQNFQWDFGDGSTSTYATPTHTFINNGESIEYFTITLIGTSAFGCVDTGSTTIPVYPAPIAQYEVNQAAGCGPLEVLFRNLSINATNFSWEYGDGETSSNPDIAHAHVYDPNATTVQSYVATLIATNSQGCSSEYSSVIQVYPQVTAAFIDPDSICAPANLSLTNASTNASNYQWNFGNGLQSVAANPSTFYSNTSSDPVAYDIQLIATSVYNCADTVVHDVVVLPQALAQFSTDVIAGCSPVTVEITNQSLNADLITWTYGDGTNSETSAAIHTHDYINNGFVADEFSITLSIATAFGCASNYTSSVLIYPGMAANFTPPASYCSPANVGFANTSVNAVSYQWDFGNGSISALPSPTAFFLNETEEPISYDVTLIATSSFGCVDSLTQSVTINPTPYAAFLLNTLSGCAPLDVVVDNNTLRADAVSWNFGDGVTSTSMDTTIFHTYYNNGNTPLNLTIQLFATTNEGCTSQMAQNLTVYPTVVANFGEPGVFCSPANVSFVNSSFNAVSYQWDFGNGLFSVMQNPNSYYTNQSGDSQVLDVTLIAASAFGCLDTVVKSVTIHSTPVAAFMPSITGGCSPLVVSFDQNSIAADEITWSFGDGFSETTLDTLVDHTYYNLTNAVVEYNVLMTATDDAGCSAQATTVVQVYPLIQASFGDPGSHCSPVNVSFFNTSTPGTTYFWDFGNGVQSVMQNPTVFFVNNADTVAVFDITLTATSPFGCSMIASYPMSVYPAPVAEFVMGENAACAPAPIPFYNLSERADSYYWSYGDGTSSTTADSIHIHDFLDLGNGSAQYQIALTAITEFGCTDTAQANFTLYPAVNASYLVDTIGCSPFNTQFINQSAGAVSYQWLFGDAQTSSAQSPTHVYTAGFLEDETYTATLIAYSIYGCADTLTREVVAQHTPQSVIQVDSLYGCSPTSVVFQNQSIGADQYLWNYGTGQTSTTSEVQHTFDFLNVTSGMYSFQVSLLASTSAGCSNTSFVNVEIPPQLIAHFESLEQGCSPLDVTFDNLTQGGTDFAWSFGDGSFSNAFEPQHSFTNWTNSDTTFIVRLITQNPFGCSDTTESIITVFGNPLAGFEVTPQTQVWPNATVELQNTTIGGSLGYTWNMGNGFSLFEENPDPYSYETWGEYNIQLVVSNGSCADTTYRIIEIIPPAAVANFEGPAEGCAPLTVQFTNLSEYAVASNWNFGDGGQSNSTNPIYTFWQAGTYTVSLTVVGPDGQTDQMVQEQIIVVHPRAQAAFVVTPSDVDVPGEAVFCLNLSNFAVEYAWDFGDGETSSEENPQHYYQAEGDYDVTLIATSAFGCSDTLMLASVVHADASGKIEFPNAFTPSTTGGSNGSYDVHSLDNDVFFPIHNGIDTYELMIFNKWGEMLFKSTDVNKGWDGYYRGVLVPQDVYVWKVRGTFVDGRAYQDSGDVTLIVK